MEYDEEKVDEMTLALLWLVINDGGYGTTRAWVTSVTPGEKRDR